MDISSGIMIADEGLGRVGGDDRVPIWAAVWLVDVREARACGTDSGGQVKRSPPEVWGSARRLQDYRGRVGYGGRVGEVG